MHTRCMATSTLPSPLGPVVLTGSDDGLASLSFGPWAAQDATGHARDDGAFRRTAEQLEQWFAGERRDFDLPLALAGTPFQVRVWELLCQVPYGTTTSYGVLAAELGSPGASRAVGMANARNRIGLVVPCHRVIGRDGTLTGYAGGLPTKRWLLAHESAHVGAALF